MSSSHSSTQSDSASAASDALTPPAETVRSCADREHRLTEYIRAHTGEDIAVRLTPHVPTACVIPTSEEALTDSDNAEFSDDEARQLVESVDADYLVLISTHPATVDNLPIDDQLTADRAQQFGSALHELGHIRYTAIADAAARLEDRVDEAHQEFVHGLWNACEDAAIENQLRLDQSQIAADRIELVRRSISTHAEEYQTGESCAFTFRDAIETALYDEGIYDTGVRDALCDPDDDRIVFAGDADRQAYEQVADSINELVATVLSTPNSVERIEHILDWWENVVKPLLDPSQQNQQESGQPDPDRATGESSANASSSDNSGSSADGETEKPTDESADADRSSAEGEADRTSESTPESSSSGGNPDSSRTDEDVIPDEMGEADESEESSRSEVGDQPDPDAINTDQRQSHPGADVLDYPDIGGDEDADALRQPDHDGEDEGEAGSTGDGGDEEGSADDHQDVSGEDDARENADTVGGSDTDTGSDEGGDADPTPDSGTDAGNSEETPGSDDGRSSQNDDSGANHDKNTDVAGENNEQGSGDGSEGQTSESQSQSQSQSQPTGNPWGTSNDTSQTSLGSFSASESQTESGASASDSGGSDESPVNESDAKRDGPSTGAGDANEPESESESDESDTGGDSGNDTTDGSDENSTDDGSNTSSGNDSESVGDEGPAESGSIEDESPSREDTATGDDRTADTDSSDTTSNDGDEEREGTSNESASDANEQPPAPSPAHTGGEESLDREGALETDHEAAHDEAERATPDEIALEHDLEDVADALDVLDEQDGGGATPGSLSELAIMPDTEGSNTADTAERWGDAAADAEFVADALRKALKESRRDADRSGVTSGTFDRQRAGALARGDVGAFSVRQPGDDKQYDLVMILDRSGSMRRHMHIDTAEDALVRFAIACEDIGINVGVVDFTQDEARLVKPFSVECEHVRESLLSKQYGGGTPLADALGLGRELLEQRRNSPLVLVVTDGKPGDADAYHDELAQSYAPVCGLTLVLDQPSGSVPEKVARNERFYDRHVYIHESSQLANRLDQFAVMFDGL